MGTIECGVVLEQPRLASYVPLMRQRLARALGLAAAEVSVKAKTAEGLGPVGQGLEVQAWATALLQQRPAPEREEQERESL